MGAEAVLGPFDKYIRRSKTHLGPSEGGGNQVRRLTRGWVSDGERAEAAARLRAVNASLACVHPLLNEPGGSARASAVVSAPHFLPCLYYYVVIQQIFRMPQRFHGHSGLCECSQM